MDADFSTLFNREIANSTILIQELIFDVSIELAECGIPAKWSKVNSIDGYYFSLLDPNNKKNEITFGVWNELWSETGYPLCISFDLKSFTVEEMIISLTDFIETNHIKGLEIIEKSDIVSICFSMAYLIEIKYAKEIVALLVELIQRFGFLFGIVRKKW